MLKDTTISVLTGTAISRYFNQPDIPARLAIILIVAVTAFTILLELDDLWDRRHRIIQRIRSWMRWYKIRLRTYPAELAQRRRRRKMMQEYIQRIQQMSPQERGKNPEESEV